jgi:uncharacterized protein (TIGR03067 family)
MKNTYLVAVSALALVFAAVGRADENNDAELKKLEGTWKVKSMEAGGKKEEVIAPRFEKMRIVFKGNTLTVKDGPQGDQETTFEIDTSKKPPHITIQPPKKSNEKTINAIYKLNGDKFTLCGSTGERPTEYKTTEGSDTYLMVFERVKD